MALVASEIRSVAAKQCSLGVQSAARDDPTDVRPPGAVVRGVRVTVLVGVLMMDAVSGNPEDRSALKAPWCRRR